jgi:glycosyltransferase involved in cell wall biosynthesis
MRIMHLSRAAETLRWFLIPAMNAQRARGHDVCICTGDGPDAEALRAAGFPVFSHGMRRSLNPAGALRAIWRIRRVIREQKIEAVICHNSLAGVVGRIAVSMSPRTRFVYFAHGLACGPAQSALNWTVRYLVERGLAPLTDAIIVMNDYDERLARRTPLAKDAGRVFRIAGMGVDLERFTPEVPREDRARLEQELSIAPAQKIVLSVARLIPEKGVGQFVEAALEICRQRRDACFLLAGTGPLLDRLRGMVSGAGAGDGIRVLGWRNDIQTLMKCSDIFALPSYYMEGLPVSILEAMACGKPVVSTHHKGCEDAVVDGSTGFLVPSRQVAPLADRITALLDDDRLRMAMGRAGRQRVEREFQLADCTRTIVDVMEKAIAAPQREPGSRNERSAPAAA